MSTKPKLTAVAKGKFMELALSSGADISPSAMGSSSFSQLMEAGYLESWTPPLSSDRTVEAQRKANEKNLAFLAHWAKNACPLKPFGKQLSQTHHPATKALRDLREVVEYKSCMKVRISAKGWAYLATLGISKPAAADATKPCGS